MVDSDDYISATQAEDERPTARVDKTAYRDVQAERRNPVTFAKLTQMITDNVPTPSGACLKCGVADTYISLLDLAGQRTADRPRFTKIVDLREDMCALLDRMGKDSGKVFFAGILDTVLKSKNSLLALQLADIAGHYGMDEEARKLFVVYAMENRGIFDTKSFHDPLYTEIHEMIRRHCEDPKYRPPAKKLDCQSCRIALRYHQEQLVRVS